MTCNSLTALAAATVLLFGGVASAGADETRPKLVIDGVEITTVAKGDPNGPLDEVVSGWHFRNSETQQLQTDDFDNPGFLLVELGQDLWNVADGGQGKSCATCHNDVEDSMPGVRAAMPKWDEAKGKPQTLEQHINTCRTERMEAEAWKWDSNQMLGMTALIGLQSRGMPVAVQTDGPMQSWWEQGKEMYYTRTGQLDLSCASCHEQNQGNMLRADRLSQGHVNGFPVYRLKWQGLGSIHKRFKGCVRDTRAETYDVGSDEFIALEIYVASRGKGLDIETPSVRN